MIELMISGSRLPALTASVISAIWLGLCAYYIHAEVGWSSFTRFLPHELGAFIAGIFAPLAFLWLAIAFARRHTGLNQVEGMVQAVKSATQRSETMADGLRRQSEALGRSADGAVESLRGVGAEFERQARELKDNYAAAAGKITDVIESLKDKSSSLDGASGVAEECVASIGQVSMEHAESLSHASKQAVQQISRVGDGVESNIDQLQTALIKASVQATEKGDACMTQAGTLREMAETAETQADRIRRNPFDAKQDMLLRASKFVIEELNSMAVDLNRLWNSDRTDKLWPEYAKDDPRILVRGILPEDENEARQVIRHKYEHDDNFRKFVLRFIDHFEKLLVEANESDPENLLSSTFLSADVGKLYLRLARAVGRLN